MMTQPKDSNQDLPGNKQKTQKRKQKDEKSAETAKSKKDMPISERIVPSFPSQNKLQKIVKPLKSKTDLKNVTKKVTKKVNRRSKKTEESANIDDSVSGETLEINEAAVDKETAPLDSEKTEEEQLPEIMDAQSSTCNLQSQDDNKDGHIVCKDDATLENIDDSTNKTKDLNNSEMSEESSIVDVSVAQIPLESNLKNFDLKNFDLKNSDLKNSDPKNSDLKNSDLKNSDLKNSDLKNSGTKQKSKNEDSEKFDEKRIVSRDTEHSESSEERKLMTDNNKESNDQTMSIKQHSSQNDVKFNPKYCGPSQEPKTMIDNYTKSNDQTVINKKIILASDAECEESSEEPIDNCKESSDDQYKNNENSTKNETKSNPLYCQPSQDQRAITDNWKESNDQTISNKQNCSQNDVKPNPKYCEPSEESRIISDNLSNDQMINKQNSSQNDVKSNLLSEFETSQSISKQNTFIQDQSSLNDSNQTVLIQAENSNEVQPIIKSINEFIGLIGGIPKVKDISPIKSPILKVAVEKEEKNHSIPQSCKKQVSEISGFSGGHIKDTLIIENDDLDISDSQLCATEWTGDSSPENKSKKNDCYLAKFKKAEKEGSQIVNELINELSRLNKLLLHYKREIDSVWKRRKISPATIHQNVIKKRAPVQTILGQFR